MRTVPIDRLRELLKYSPDNGSIVWAKTSSNRAVAGSPAGCLSGNRRVLRVDGVLLKAHRVAWALNFGEWPNKLIDHINGDPTDNRLCNLRACSHGENMQNMRKARSDSQSKMIGAQKDRNRWVANIRIDGRKSYLGSFGTAKEAHEAYVIAKRRIHSFCSI